MCGVVALLLLLPCNALLLHRDLIRFTPDIQNYRQVVRGEVKNPSLGNFPLRGEGIPPLSVNLFPFRKKVSFET